MEANQTTTQSFPLWNYELILFTHNALKKDLSTGIALLSFILQ